MDNILYIIIRYIPIKICLNKIQFVNKLYADRMWSSFKTYGRKDNIPYDHKFLIANKGWILRLITENMIDWDSSMLGHSASCAYGLEK